MKFSTYLEQITGVGIYPVISLILFVTFFLSVTFWLYSIDKNEISRIEKLPLDEN